jgi:hypothetical protein
MSNNKTAYKWSSPEKAKDCEAIECAPYDPIKGFKRDPSGYYVLIKINFESSRIEVGICAKDHKIVKVFSGRTAQDLYNTIFQYEKAHKAQWFREKAHIAYLGKELKKAELALVLGNNAYFQE